MPRVVNAQPVKMLYKPFSFLVDAYRFTVSCDFFVNPPIVRIKSNHISPFHCHHSDVKRLSVLDLDDCFSTRVLRFSRLRIS